MHKICNSIIDEHHQLCQHLLVLCIASYYQSQLYLFQCTIMVSMKESGVYFFCIVLMLFSSVSLTTKISELVETKL